MNSVSNMILSFLLSATVLVVITTCPGQYDAVYGLFFFRI